MRNDTHLNSLFHFASEYRFLDFDRRLAESAPKDIPLEAYLMQAQIKLFSCDDTLLGDLEVAGRAAFSPRYPSLNTLWLSDCPNRFVVFSPQQNALQALVKMLPGAGAMLRRWYGEIGEGMVRQIAGELLYFMGRFDDAVYLAGDRPQAQTPLDALLTQCTLFRCYLATGYPEKAQQCVLNMVALSKAHPQCMSSYQTFREWANATTGWSGDTPRYHEGPAGDDQPLLEDRLNAIRRGISRMSQYEEPFVDYALSRYKDAYTVRRHYMAIFHALYWYNAGDCAQMKYHFDEAYRISSATGLMMPFAEYGRQILPLLKHVEKSGTNYSKEWLDKLSSLANQYEDGLNAYRS